MGLSFSGIIIYTQIMLSNVWVTVLELNHGHISRHFRSAWWPRNFGFCRISSNLDFEASYRPVVFRNHYLHPGDAFERLGNSSGAPPWPYFSTFLVRMVVRFLVDFRVSGFRRFWDLSRPADQEFHQRHPVNAFKRLGHSSGSYS